VPNLQQKIKGPDNPTCQLSSSKQQKKGKDGMGKGKTDGEGLVWSKLCVEE